VSSSRRRRVTGINDRFDEARKRWVRVEGLEYVQYAVPAGERDRGEGARESWGVTHLLSIFSKRTSHKFVTDLSEMTVAELDAVQEFLNTVFDEAREVCEHRDRLAREAFEDGDDSLARLYREVPRVVDRSRKGEQHGQGKGR
jgi:hypothetical protein